MRGSRLIPEVQAFVDSGKLNDFDADWIQNLSANLQLAAAEKCMKSTKDLGGVFACSKSVFKHRDSKGPRDSTQNGD